MFTHAQYDASLNIREGGGEPRHQLEPRGENTGRVICVLHDRTLTLQVSGKLFDLETWNWQDRVENRFDCTSHSRRSERSRTGET